MSCCITLCNIRAEHVNQEQTKKMNEMLKIMLCFMANTLVHGHYVGIRVTFQDVKGRLKTKANMKLMYNQQYY